MKKLFSVLRYGSKRRNMARRIVAKFVNRKKEEMLSGYLRLSHMSGFTVPKQLGDAYI